MMERTAGTAQGPTSDGRAIQVDSRSDSLRRRRRKPPRFGRDDVRHTLLYVLSALIVRVLPQRLWEGAARVLGRSDWIGRKSRGEQYPRYRRALRAVIGNQLGEARIEALFARSVSEEPRAALYVAASRARAGWSPAIRLSGEDVLQRALGRGRGAILWFDNFALATTAGKRAIAEAGYRMWYLSGYAHGFTYTRFANRFLNWRLIEVESRYLAGRIVFDENSTVVATRRIVEILARNGVVGIANNPLMGETMRVPLDDTGVELTLARAPLSIAASRGAALLPVAVIEVEPYATFDVSIGAEIDVPDSLRPVSEMAAANYARYLLPLLRAHPHLWPWATLQEPRQRSAGHPE